MSLAQFSKSTGSVKFFDVKKGFGFIVPSDGSPDIFVHQSSIVKEGFRSLREAEEVEYEVDIDSTSGKPRAINVTGPNGTPVLGIPPPKRIQEGENSFSRFADRGESPRRHNSGDGPKSYPKKRYDPNQSEE
eukprot:CAMPEP_0196761528 /NCGR_PEP_ID=MMETSP1095-20130614/798_1 /TAXON_ID=96789 ORGANISM="Chromulina nebulosa, Strain UTEXLB2642" /NCGR_SAMPLE_ID=MMETSP1095 /ASSEMBLY_ACC=CAM_ASM_000446 /LENGTH=131 /DNA_ID=CAMNT_0042111193 /DNA_START=93 /DNA_END=488 /DNA_ORIENTATION=+